MIPAPTVTKENPEFRQLVDNRAVALCLAHTEGQDFNPRCPHHAWHWHEARRQVFDEWQKQGEG